MCKPSSLPSVRRRGTLPPALCFASPAAVRHLRRREIFRLTHYFFYLSVGCQYLLWKGQYNPQKSALHVHRLVDWDVECGSGNTGYVPAVLYQPRKEPAAASHWCITGVGAEEKCARSWRESSVTLGALRGLIPDPSALHELLVVRVVSADLRKVCNCRVELALFPCTAATAVVTQTCSPRFDKTFLLTYAPGVPLDVCVKDVGRLWDAVVGTVHIDLQAAPADGGKPVSQRCVPLVPTPEAPYTLLDSHHEAVGTLRLGIYLARSISRHKII
eukprot:TRINITY_DN2054_c0_g1_i10.p1 TRINITY_DN2054_c0_g1~~TRINITY_DN2054_c0_g1_i10.p1  ORF type:complete len:273 (-),score=32.76 TRINITY_DN2054_c0_g1_i10:23-841(-)